MAFFIYYFGTKYSRYTRENTVVVVVVVDLFCIYLVGLLQNNTML